MSTILNALKRLEDERREGASVRTPRAMAGETRYRPHLSAKALLGGTVLAVALGAMVLLGLNRGLPNRILSPGVPEAKPPAAAVEPDRHDDHTADTPAADDPPMAASESTAPARSAPSRASAAPESRQQPAAVARQTVPPVYSKSLRARPLSTRPSPERSSSAKQRAAPDDQSLLRSAVGSDLPSSGAPPESGADRQPSSGTTPVRAAEPLARGILKLQAISWSDVPSARLTIIDGRILREGDTVEGFSVLHIEPENVVLGKDGKRWQLTYENR